MAKEQSDKDKNYWMSFSLRVFAESTGWIAFPVLGALYFGRWLDTRQNSGHLYFFSLTGMAFIISCIGLARTGQKYLKQFDTNKSKEEITHHEPRDESNK